MLITKPFYTLRLCSRYMEDKKRKIDVESKVFEQLSCSFDIHTVKLAKELLNEARLVLDEEDMVTIINNKLDKLYREIGDKDEQ